ncbi:MAG TPA: DMT family transporter [Candidatus Limnocylindrales bacterium]|nr:DMT family transporter [Candidatus Limnocylindrales bacterium]
MTPEVAALFAAIAFALFAVYGWLGLRSSTPLTATIVSLAARTITLGAAVLFVAGIPQVASLALTVFVALGVMQTAISLLTFIGLQKIGTSRSQPLRNSYPLWSALIAVALMGEHASIAVLAGTLAVVIGVIFISWKPEAAPKSYRWWHVLYSTIAGLLAGIAFPLRRYGLTISNEPVFFSFVVAIVSLIGTLPYTLWTQADRHLVWHHKSVRHFFLSGFFEALGALLTLMALTTGRVVIVSPIVATTPLFSLVISLIFLRGKEKVTGLTIVGTVAVVIGSIAIAMGR